MLVNREESMKNNKGFILGIITASWFLSTSVSAHQQQDISCFKNIKLSSSFIALETAFDSGLYHWYKELFQLEMVK